MGAEQKDEEVESLWKRASIMSQMKFVTRSAPTPDVRLRSCCLPSPPLSRSLFLSGVSVSQRPSSTPASPATTELRSSWSLETTSYSASYPTSRHSLAQSTPRPSGSISLPTCAGSLSLSPS